MQRPNQGSTARHIFTVGIICRAPWQRWNHSLSLVFQPRKRAPATPGLSTGTRNYPAEAAGSSAGLGTGTSSLSIHVFFVPPFVPPPAFPLSPCGSPPPPPTPTPRLYESSTTFASSRDTLARARCRSVSIATDPGDSWTYTSPAVSPERSSWSATRSSSANRRQSFTEEDFSSCDDDVPPTAGSGCGMLEEIIDLLPVRDPVAARRTGV